MFYLKLLLKMYVIIIATNVTWGNPYRSLELVMNAYPKSEILSWSVDMNDVDRVLRVVSRNDTSQHLISELRKNYVLCNLMEVFDRCPV